MPSATHLSLLLLLAIVLAWLVEALLLKRQIRHVQAHRAAVPPAFAERVSLNEHQRAADYTVAKARLELASSTFGTAFTALLVLGGVAWGWQVTGHLAQALGLPTHGIAHEMLLAVLLALASGLVGLPFSWWSSFRIEERFGFNRMNQATFWLDLLKSTLVSAILLLPLLAALFWLMRQAGPTWWLWAWGLFVAFQLVMYALYPTLIAPLFNKFTPLERADTRAAIEALLARTGFAAKGLFVMDGSRRSAHGNAYFTGLGRARRIVFYDTLLERLDNAEIVAVLAHELGHFKRRHIVKRMALLVALSGAFFALLAKVMDSPLLAQALGLPADALARSPGLALIVLAIVLPPLFFWLSPLMAWYSRQHEFEADAYAAEVASGHDLIGALLKLYRDNASTLTPDPVYSTYHHSHPPATIRIQHLQSLPV